MRGHPVSFLRLNVKAGEMLATSIRNARSLQFVHAYPAFIPLDCIFPLGVQEHTR